MSKQTQHVLEYSRPSVQGNVIRGVKIIGLESKHGYAYPADVLGRAVALYEGAPVFLMHPDPREKRQGHRLLRDHFGNLENVSSNGNGLFGDLNVRSSHPLAAQILEEAPTASFGLSHNAVVERSEDGSVITNIVEVKSVDLVDDPATTRNLFEENTMPEKKAGGVEDSFQTIVVGYMEKLDKLLTHLEPQKADVIEGKEQKRKPVKRLTALENRGDEEGGGQPIGNTHDDFMGAIRGFPLK